MWNQLKKELTDLISILPFVEYFRNLEERLYQVELILYKRFLMDTIDSIIERYKDMEIKRLYIIKETPISLDRKYEKDYDYLCTIMEVLYKNNETVSVSADIHGSFGSLILTHLDKKKIPAKKKSTPLRKVKNTVGILIISGLLSCTNASIAQFKALGSAGQIKCYSGGKLIYDGESTGKIGSEQQSDGWYFEEKGTGNLIRVSGDCIIRN